MFEATDPAQTDLGGAQQIAILAYHSLDTSGSVVSIAPQTFADQVLCIADAGMRGISLQEALAYRDARGSWPERSVVLTFDDGFANFYEFAWPVLARHRFTATVFIITGHMSKDNSWAPPPAGLGTRKILSWRQAADIRECHRNRFAHQDAPGFAQLFNRKNRAGDVVVARRDRRSSGRTGKQFRLPLRIYHAAAQRIVARVFRAGCTTVLKHAGADALHSLPRIDAYYLRSRRNFRRLLDGQLNGYLVLRRLGRIVRHNLPFNS
ncbi:MAG: polysaccharide deacetylase family protein [Pyrinomonadaceae bacterium]